MVVGPSTGTSTAWTRGSATLAIAAAVAFAPSFAFVLLGGAQFERIRTSARARAFLAGAGPAAIGAILGAAIPLAGVGCAIERRALGRIAALQEGRPFAGTSMTEDYELGLRLGALGHKTMFVRIPAGPGEHGVVASRGHFPSTLGTAVRQKARWLGGIALSGWDRLGWSGGLGDECPGHRVVRRLLGRAAEPVIVTV